MFSTNFTENHKIILVGRKRCAVGLFTILYKEYGEGKGFEYMDIRIFKRWAILPTE